MSNTINNDRRQFVLASMTMAGGILLSHPAFSSTPAAVSNVQANPAQADGPTVLRGTSPRLTIHLLDSYHGGAATGLCGEFSRVEEGRTVLLHKFTSNQNGRTDEPLLIGDAYQVGNYELLLHVDEYYRMKKTRLESPSFFSTVPIRFRINRADERLHLPVQFGPWNYTFYRGS